jgi:hypothetical protein
MADMDAGAMTSTISTEAQESDEKFPSSQTQSTSHHISRASYPIPQPLVQRLKAGILLPNQGFRERQVESLHDGLAQLVSNSIEAMDAMYFATPPQIRQHSCFQHRLCVRIRVDPEAQTISITDLGIGMTRADLINSLGVGRSAGLESSSNGYESRNRSTSQTEEEDQSTAEDSDSSDDELDQTDDDDETGIEEESEAQDGNEGNPEYIITKEPSISKNTSEDNTVLRCKAKDLGGFYAALCSLGTGVCVRTKSKFDDYYEAEIGVHSAEQNFETAFDEFRIVRPRDEGIELTVEEGFDQFQDLRGESGTSVTMRLNPEAIAEGFLDEAKLKSIFLKIVETTQYTVAFSSDEEAVDIVNASAIERKTRQALEMESTEIDLDAVADMEIRADDRQPSGSHNTVKERAKYIPLRLSLGERKMLRLMEASMTCTDYTTHVDRPFKSTSRRVHEQLKGVTSVLRGLVTACDYAAGQQLLQDDNYAHFEKFFRQMFEIARRHKIMNPEKMRTEYGKVIYLLQDAVSPSLRPHLGFSIKGPIESVYKFLEDRRGLEVLSDKLIETATEEILAGWKSRSQIDQEIRQKERAVSLIKRKYRSSLLTSEDIHLCLYSICDNNSFLNSNRVPIDKVIDYLTKHFSPEHVEEGYSLSIVSGEDGSRLSHSHERQYYFALQSLTLWRDIVDDMFRLWAMAEEDLLSDSVSYVLHDTGQGMQRVQQSPQTYRAMRQVLVRVQSKVSHWIGSNMIHLGDHNVPNALSFIDKYTQVPRILAPIVTCLENLEQLCEKDDGIQQMIDDGFGGVKKLRQDILYDFFRSAFDGSGANNFYDAGSCIDGRLTSAWNWCSQLPTKPFYPIFKLTGFTGFDGDFK